MINRRPESLEEFIARPVYNAWRAELADGWPGPDGSSQSTDTIMGVRIGRTSRLFRYVDLPANRHDWYYRLGRKWRLPEAWRRAADKVYRDLCLERCRAELVGWKLALRPVAVARCHGRYAALRAGARFAWTEKARRRRSAWKDEG